MKINPVQLQSFAGLDLDTQPLRAAQDAIGRLTASIAQNVYISPITSEVIKMPGSSAWNATACPGGPPARLIPYRHLSGKVVWFARTATGYFKRDDDGNGWNGGVAHYVTVGQSLQVPAYAQIGRTLIIVDGENALYWDGQNSTFSTTRTVDPPKGGQVQGNNRPSLAVTTSGSLTAGKTYQIAFTFVSANGESAPLHAGNMPVADSTNDAIILSTGYSGTDMGANETGDGIRGSGYGLNVIPNGVTDINIYVRDIGSTDASFYRSSQINVEDTNAGTEITASILTLPSTNPLTVFNGPPAGCNVVCEHIGRAIYTGSPCWPVRIWLSEAGSPLTIKGYSWIDVGAMDDPIVAVASLPLESPVLAILKRSSTWVLGGYDADTFISGLRLVDAENGCLYPHQPIVRQRKVYFIGSSGAFVFDGGIVQPIHKGILTELQSTMKGAA